MYNRGGAEEARGAHNSEVVGSNPTSGIHFNSPALQKLVVKLDVKRSNLGKPPPWLGRKTSSVELLNMLYANIQFSPNYWWLSLFLIKRTVQDRYLQVVKQHQRRTCAFSALEPSRAHASGVITSLHSSVGERRVLQTSSNNQMTMSVSLHT